MLYSLPLSLSSSFLFLFSRESEEKEECSQLFTDEKNRN
jgi:hypothetical protein